MDGTSNIVCNLTERDVRTRKNLLRQSVQPYLVQAIYRDGASILTFSKPGVTKETVEHLIALERECCPFFEFDLRESDQQFRLEISGPEGSQDLVRNFFSPQASKSCACAKTGLIDRFRSPKTLAFLVAFWAAACLALPALAAFTLTGFLGETGLRRTVEIVTISLIAIWLGHNIMRYCTSTWGKAKR